MPKVTQRSLTPWETKEKQRQQAAQALKQQKIEQYSLAKHGTLRRAVRANTGVFVAWTPQQ